jgi:hypothetical protein
MGIFNISNISTTENVSKAVKNPTDPVPDVKIGTEPATPAATDNAAGNKGKNVVMTGPLSKIYSEALNLAYGKESVMNMLNPEDMELMDEQAGTADEKDLYVYTTDGSKMDGQEMVQASDKLRLALDSKKYKKVILAVECVTPTRKVALLHDMATSMGIDVVFNRKAAIESMKGYLK